MNHQTPFVMLTPESHYSPMSEYELPSLENFFPRPPRPADVEAAQQDVMLVAYEEFPHHPPAWVEVERQVLEAGNLAEKKKFDQLKLRASDLADQLRKRNHTLAAALFGIRQTVLSGELFVMPTIPPYGSERTAWSDVAVYVAAEWTESPLSATFRDGPAGSFVNEHDRTIHRPGFESVDLSGKPLCWFIFQEVLHATGATPNMEGFRARYESKEFAWDKRFTAVHELNKHLAPVGVRVKKWRLEPLP